MTLITLDCISIFDMSLEKKRSFPDIIKIEKIEKKIITRIGTKDRLRSEIDQKA
jgi:hypothetical protein